MRKMENFCVDCETCVKCSNYKDKEIAYCDGCSEQNIDEYYKPEDDELCYDCAYDWAVNTQYDIIDVDNEDEVNEFLEQFKCNLEDKIESEVC